MRHESVYEDFQENDPAKLLPFSKVIDPEYVPGVQLESFPHTKTMTVQGREIDVLGLADAQPESLQQP